MTVQEIIQEMVDLGITAKVVGGKLVLKGFDSRASKDLMFSIDKNKEALIDLFSAVKQDTKFTPTKTSSTTLEFSKITRLPQFAVPVEPIPVTDDRASLRTVTDVFLDEYNKLTVVYSDETQTEIMDMSFDYGYF